MSLVWSSWGLWWRIATYCPRNVPEMIWGREIIVQVVEVVNHHANVVRRTGKPQMVRFVETFGSYVGIVSFAVMVHQFVLVIAYLSGIQSGGMRTQMTWLEYYQYPTVVDGQET